MNPGQYRPCTGPGWVYVVALEAQIPTWGDRGGGLEEELGEGVKEKCADTDVADVCIFAGIVLRIFELHQPFCTLESIPRDIFSKLLLSLNVFF